MKRLQHVRQDFRHKQNLEIYIVICLALTASALDVFQPDNQAYISAATLAVLGAVSFFLLGNRHENREIQAAIAKINATVTLPESFLLHEYDRYYAARPMHTARKIFFWGQDFQVIVPTVREDLERGLRNGLEVRFLFIEPSSEAARMAVFSETDRDLDEFNRVIEGNLATVSRLARSTPAGKLDVRVINYFPGLNITAIDPDLPTGRMLVRMVSFRNRYPTFELTRAEDGKWFDFLVQQFEAVWKEAKEIKSQ
jgi:hypothetical protein